MAWPIRNVLLIPAVSAPRRAGTATPPGAPRLPAVLHYLLKQLRDHGCTATVGLDFSTVHDRPDLARAVVTAGCEIAAMTDPSSDPWSLPPGALRDDIEAVVAALVELGLAAPSRFLPPHPANHAFLPVQVAALREAGIRQSLGCAGLDLAALPLAEFLGRPLNGDLLRLVPAWLVRQALAQVPGRAIALSPLDIDPGAPGGPWGRAGLLTRLPRLLAGGFVSAAQFAVQARSG